jgi:single-strand DNA-binding protein
VNETQVTVTGIVASDLRVINRDDGLRLTSFRLASTPRRRGSDGEWADGDTTWMTVTCWRTLATNVADSVARKDRVMIRGRLKTREWEGTDGGRRTEIEIDADSVGHDLRFGTSVFTRGVRSPGEDRPATSTDTGTGTDTGTEVD